MPDWSGLARPTPVGWLSGCLVLLAWLLAPAGWRDVARERTFDTLLAVAAGPIQPQRITFVDIDAASLAELGPWPWPRETIAHLIEAVATARPASIAVDIVLAGEDTRSPAALARQLGRETGRADITALAQELVDGDKALIAAVAKAPVALGYALDPRGTARIPNAPILSRNGGQIGSIWGETGASGPVEALASAADGAGILSLPGDQDGVVRRVPVFAAAGGEVLPSLAVEALRLAAGASSYMISGAPPQFVVGALNRPLPRDGFVRLAPQSIVTCVSLSAAAVMAKRANPAALADAIVVIGSSAPELGALRPSAANPLTPSPLLHAAAIISRPPSSRGSSPIRRA